mmetsp:Transcript_39873/g.40666  ORF Transcript_39873/g.40666 Transcript_39873/m.40666 type:complete len:346 (+) Transcript_39873:157-1194(+)|eukprot:CAMPEP_0182438968 /NCGR_PEP_ID=MMETSP1167-20130531/86139_1 /TAXON_ID=2988 /ORGANISM="Mallomonas Sp, Strain CCMP3275" /LENGTH=345 /DNA_ID=CAMNT_0024632541 /DNA_START=124 /DNA_END=1161 /DNA_ORIENTATION=+
MNSNAPKTALIFLHGSGGNGAGTKSSLDCIPLKAFQYKTFREIAESKGIIYFTPTAPKRPYTPALNTRMNVWFDRSDKWQSLNISNPHEDIDGIESSIEQIMTLIHELTPEFPRIFVGGHSMGGCLSLHLLRKPLPVNVKGIFSIGSFICQASCLFTSPIDVTVKRPVLMMHGSADSGVKPSWGEHTATSLLLKGVDVEFRKYPRVEHSYEDSQLSDLLQWISLAEDSTMPPAPPSPSVLTAATDTSSSVSLDSTTLDYSIHSMTDTQESMSYRVIFPMPRDMIAMIISRPVLACGGEFILTEVPEGIQTIFTSSDPERTAYEIGMRLKNRVSSDGNSLNACPMS